jgi:glycosyltransferase involved in cell wall biosynthesis
MRVAVVAEFYPRATDPVLGVWAHRQALATLRAGAEVSVLVLRRPIPSRATLGDGPGATAGELLRLVRQPHRETRDGLQITYVPFVAPERGRTYTAWGAWAAPSLALALRRLRRRFPFDLVHAHNAVPAGDAVRRARLNVPTVVSVHGGDVLFTAPRLPGGPAAVRRSLAAARLVLANSAGIERLALAHGARDTRVVPLGTDLPEPSFAPGDGPPTLVTVGHLVARKRHADVIRALAVLAERHSRLRYVIVGDGPERDALAELAAQLGVATRVELRGQRPPADALREARQATLFVMPSTEEALGVAYLEAMAAGIPALGCRGEPGPEEIAAAGQGMRLVAPADPAALAAEIDALLSDADALAELGARARETVEGSFTWERCGRLTVAAYGEALRPLAGESG